MEVLFQHVKEISKLVIYLNFNPFFKFYSTPQASYVRNDWNIQIKMYNFPLSIDLIYFLWLNDIKIPYMFSNLMSAHEKILKNMGINLSDYNKCFLSLAHIYLTFMSVFSPCVYSRL